MTLTFIKKKLTEKLTKTGSAVITDYSSKRISIS